MTFLFQNHRNCTVSSVRKVDNKLFFKETKLASEEQFCNLPGLAILTLDYYTFEVQGLCLELGLGPCYLRAGHGTVFWHDPKHGTTRNILGRAGTTCTQGPCHAQDLGTVGYMARPAFWAVLGPARHENNT